MGWLSENAAVASVISSVALVIVTSIYVRITRKISNSAAENLRATRDMIREMQAERLSMATMEWFKQGYVEKYFSLAL